MSYKKAEELSNMIAKLHNHSSGDGVPSVSFDGALSVTGALFRIAPAPGMGTKRKGSCHWCSADAQSTIHNPQSTILVHIDVAQYPMPTGHYLLV
jgi:hypothetical protein